MQFRSVLGRRLVAVHACLGLWGGSLLLSACSDGNAVHEPEGANSLGHVSLPLTATGASGSVYRLRQALFDVTNNGNGANVVLSSEQDPLSTTLESSLLAGNYNVSLQPGWFLEKASGGSITSVQATLMSPSTQNVDVQVNGESTLFFVFQTSGEVIQFGQGRLVVDIAV